MSLMTKSGQDRYRRYSGGGGRRLNKCHMSCDFLTPKQLKELNGEVHTYQMNKPIRWAEFKQYPAEFQQEYLDNLIEAYNVNYTSLSEMLGVGTSSIKRLIEKNHLNVTFSVGHGMTGDQRKAWKRFISQEPETPETQDAPHEDVTETPERPESTVSMTRFAVSFSGRIDPTMIANSLRHIIGDHSEGQINIEFIADTPLADGRVVLYNT